MKATTAISINTKRIWALIIFLLSVTVMTFSSCNKDKDDDNDPGVTTLQSDEFAGDNLNSYWKWAKEPDNWTVGSVSEGWLSFIGRHDANIFCDDSTSRLYQEITSTDDFDISTRMYCQWGFNDSDVAGLIVKSKSSGEWVLIKLWMWGDKTGRLEFQGKCDDIVSPVPGSDNSAGSAQYYLRIKRSGHDYTAYFKLSEDDGWTEIATYTFNDDTPLQVGIFGGTDEGDGQVLVQFDYFRK